MHVLSKQLKDIERPKASQAIADARDKGDLSDFSASFPNYVFNNMIQEKVVINMFIQIFSLLHFLQTNFNYTHNDFKICAAPLMIENTRI